MQKSMDSISTRMATPGLPPRKRAAFEGRLSKLEGRVTGLGRKLAAQKVKASMRIQGLIERAFKMNAKLAMEELPKEKRLIVSAKQQVILKRVGLL